MYSFFLTYVHSITRAFLNTNTYNHWSSVPEVRAYHVVRYNRNPSAHGLEGAVPPGPVEASTLPAGRAARRRAGGADLPALAYRATSLRGDAHATSLVPEGHASKWTSI